MAPAGWRNKLSVPKAAQQQQSEERDHLLMLEAIAVKKHQQAFSAKELVDTRKALIAHVKEIAARGKGESIVAMERDFVANDLERYARVDDKEMTGSLNAALQGFAAIERKHRMVDNLEEYQRVNEEFSFPKNRKQGLPLDEARQSFSSHRARLGNYVKYRLEETEKQFVRERSKALSIAEQDYIARQARTLGVELPQRAKPAQANSNQGRLFVQEAAKRDALERAYTSLPRAEAVKAHPELADLYKLEAAIKEFADKRMPDAENRRMFLEDIRQKSFIELAKGNPLPQASILQTPQPSKQDLDPER